MDVISTVGVKALILIKLFHAKFYINFGIIALYLASYVYGIRSFKGYSKGVIYK